MDATKDIVDDTFFFVLKSIYLLQKQSDRDLPCTGSLYDCPQFPWVGQTQARSQELKPGLPGRWQGLPPSSAATQGVYQKTGPQQSEDSKAHCCANVQPRKVGR